MSGPEPAEQPSQGERERDQGIVVYLHNYSFYSQKVLMYFYERGFQFRSHFVNIASGEQYQPWYLKMNPKGEVPIIKDDENIIIDSARIISYLEDKIQEGVSKRLTPVDAGPVVMQQHDHFHSLIHDLPADQITIGSFYHQELVESPKIPFLYPVRRHMKNITERLPPKLRKLAADYPEFSETLKTKVEKIEEDLKIMKSAEEYRKVLERVDQVLSEVELQLSNQGGDKWLVNENLTVADIDLTILLERLDILGLKERFWGKRPHIQEYFRRIRQRDSYKKATPTALFHIKTFVKSVTYMQLF